MHLLVLSLLFALASATSFEDCGSTGVISALRVSGCDKSLCILPKGDVIKVEIDFVPTAATTTLTALVHGIIVGVPVPFREVDTNACNDLKVGDCPLKENEASTYSADFPVAATYPSITLKVQWQLIDEKGNSVVCWRVPARII